MSDLVIIGGGTRKRGADPKTCRRCFVDKPRSEFTPHASSKNGVQSTCRPCSAEIAKQRRAINPSASNEIQRRSKLKTMWGMTLADYDAMLAGQGGCCAICKSGQPAGMGRFHVDHDHATGRIRGLLCNRCNTGLGQFRDSVDYLKEAITYIERSTQN